ncbi:VanZ family protein [Phytoactinopolyspora halophila]|nr:VanZ family protein [Phytoactinopolyspora halophila]
MTRAFSQSVPTITFLFVVVVVVALSLTYVSHRRQGGVSVPRVVSWAGVVMSAGMVLAVTLLPAYDDSRRHLELVPFRRVFDEFARDMALVQIMANTALFVPLGFFLALTLTGGLRIRTAVAITIVVPLSIELIQYVFVAGRVASAEDWLVCSVGGLGGLALGHAARRVVVNWHVRSRSGGVDRQRRLRHPDMQEYGQNGE